MMSSLGSGKLVLQHPLGGDVDMELWLIYVTTHEKPKLTVGQIFNNA
jgi:hypothetical protein